MFYHFLYPLKEYISSFNIFQYITFRSAGAAITSIIISFFIGPIIIHKLKVMQIGELIRTDGPKTHLSKKGTPTMGGLIIVFSTVFPVLLWADLTNIYIQIILFSTLWMTTIGFIDDYLKVIKKYKKGLVARYKMAGQISLGFIIGTVIYMHPQFNEINTLISIPFLRNVELDLGYFYIPFVVFIVTGTSNAVNLTDGLDGLAAGLMGIAIVALGMISYMSGRVDFSHYLSTLYLPGAGELTIYCLAALGGLLGFLWYNSHPAQIFMGDTGSLGMGGAIGTLAILLRKEILFALLGGVFVAEALSVMIQVGYFRYTKKKYGEGRRVLKMAPLHHHYELKGIKETKIVTRFWIIGILLALLSLSSFKLL